MLTRAGLCFCPVRGSQTHFAYIKKQTRHGGVYLYPSMGRQRQEDQELKTPKAMNEFEVGGHMKSPFNNNKKERNNMQSNIFTQVYQVLETTMPS